MTFRSKALLITLLLTLAASDPAHHLLAQSSGEDDLRIARVKYRGGGDWYNDPSSLTNLVEFTRSHAPLAMGTEFRDVALGSSELHKYPFAFITGHGTISFNSAEVENLRSFLENGGFLYIDDDYGLDSHFRELIGAVYPGEELVEVPFDHPIYHQIFDFPNGLPKVHEHDNEAPQGFGLFREGRMVLFYTYESNLADGWANPEVHQNPASLREQALRMGANILVYALTSGR
ncbi:MAG: DUF4159 domain-containing protein [Balneolaceae bacterium]|nr:DUF4159 domain-containing protein [Balneolaceae bacterium]